MSAAPTRTSQRAAAASSMIDFIPEMSHSPVTEMSEENKENYSISLLLRKEEGQGRKGGRGSYMIKCFSEINENALRLPGILS